MIESLTLVDLRKLGELRPDLADFADRMLVQSYDEFVRVLNKDLDRCIAGIEEDRGVRQDDGEDRITAEIINILNGMNYDASHDEKVGGHSDIVVRHLKGYLWLGEAKIHSDYAYLEQGFNQLCTRYSPGTPNADQGGLIIYMRVQDCAAVLAKWRARVTELGLPEYEDSNCPSRDTLAFFSSHRHEGTGRAIKVRHVAVNQYFDPKDRPVVGKSADVASAEPAKAKVARTAKKRRAPA